MMKAVVVSEFGGPDVLKYVDWPMPKPTADEVLVRVEAIGVGAWDAMWREGAYPYRLPKPPFVPGQIAAGRVVEVGAAVSGLKIHDKVHVIDLTGGGYAEYMSAPAKSVIPLPDAIDLKVAACLSDYRSAWAFFQDGLRGHKAEIVCILHASGGIGMAMIQIAKFLGLRVIATARGTVNCEMLTTWGADITIDHHRGDVGEAVRCATGGRGVDLLFDHVSGPDFASNFDMLAEGGMIFVLNRRGGNAPDEIFELMHRKAAMRWKLRFWAMHVYDRHEERASMLIQDVVQMFLEGDLRPTRLNELPLARAADAHALREQGDLPGKTILLP